MLQKIVGHRAETIAGDLVVGKRRTGLRIDQLGRRQQIGEVTPAFCRSRNELYLPVGGCIGSRALVRSEIKQAVLEDRSPDAPAKLVLL